MQCFEHAFSFDPSDFCHFRKWIGESGFEQVFAYSTQLHGRTAEKKAKLVLQTLLVQGNNTTFPTDAKLCKKVIDQCNKIATKDGILQRQRYPRESKQLLCYTYNDKHLKRVKQANKAVKRLKVIAGLRYVS
jgi:IS5 family transposase